MSEFSSREEFSRLVKEREEKYEWTDAADIYESAIQALLENGEILEAGEKQEKGAYCRFRAAYQAETTEEFKTLLDLTSRTYGRAAEIYQSLKGPERDARVLTNRAMEHFYKSWLIEEPIERKMQVSRCVEEFKIALQECEDTEDCSRFAYVCNNFIAINYNLAELSFDHNESVEIIETILDYGKRNIKILKEEGDISELAKCHYLLSLFLPDRPMDVVESVERQQELHQLGMSYAEIAVELSDKVGDPYLRGLSFGVLSHYLLEVKGEIDAAISLARKQLKLGEETKDKLVLARANDYLSYYLGTWVALDEEDRDKKRTAANEGLLHANEATKYYKTLLEPILTPFLARNLGPRSFASLETNLELKRKFELEGLNTSLSDLEYATKSGSLVGRMYIYTSLGGTYLNLAKIERNDLKKEKYIAESMQYWEKYIDSAIEGQPFRYWNISVAYNKLVDLRGQLAEREENLERKKQLLSEAIADIEKSIGLYNTHISVHDIEGYRVNYAIAQTRFGEILFQMQLLSDDDSHLKKGVQYFDDAIETYKKTNMFSYIAEILWKKAWAYYQKRDFQKSTIEFDGASRYYIQASEKYSNHSQFYSDYSKYMEAWGNISLAMNYHSRDEYFLEKEYFEKAVRLLNSSERWRYLSPNYLAWARLAEAESKSRNDQCEKAIELFHESSKLFSTAKESIEDKTHSIGVFDEANMAIKLIAASNLRIDYCTGRVAIEEAKILDRNGENIAGSRRYGEAAQVFNKIANAMQTEKERQEIRPLYSLCRAWQRKTLAEAKASPDLYFEAADLFEEACKHSLNEKTRLLTRGHSSFCKALSAGLRYEMNREEQYHLELVRNIGIATDFYVRAGYDSALEYSRATQRLFEAYQYLDRARGTSDLSEKVRYFSAAERLLRVSTEAFQRASHPKKRDEVIRLLRNLKDDREIAVSLSELLDSPGISSSTESFRVPTPSHEYPVGLEGFERADIQVKMFLPDETVTLGEEFSLELELYNPGKSAAALVHVEKLVPDDFEISAVFGMFRFVNDVLDLRGKRIGPLSTVDISIRLRPHSRGDYTFKPQIVFIDDAGKQRSSVPEPGLMKVREMGILSWLRGSRPSF